jgi:molecular chaperone DnaK
VNGADKAKAVESIADLKKTREGGDNQAIKDKTEALKQVSYKIAEEIYKQQAAQGGAAGAGAGPEGPAGGPDSNTKSAEDADYEVVDDK